MFYYTGTWILSKKDNYYNYSGVHGAITKNIGIYIPVIVDCHIYETSEVDKCVV